MGEYFPLGRASDYPLRHLTSDRTRVPVYFIVGRDAQSLAATCRCVIATVPVACARLPEQSDHAGILGPSRCRNRAIALIIGNLMNVMLSAFIESGKGHAGPLIGV
jgi:hypothetical protein